MRKENEWSSHRKTTSSSLWLQLQAKIPASAHQCYLSHFNDTTLVHTLPKNPTLAHEHAIMARQSWPLQGFCIAESYWNSPGEDLRHWRCPFFSSLSSTGPALAAWSFLYSVCTYIPLPSGVDLEGSVSDPQQKWDVAVFMQTPNLSELLHTGCGDLGKPCWCAELFCNHTLMFICFI